MELYYRAHSQWLQILVIYHPPNLKVGACTSGMLIAPKTPSYCSSWKSGLSLVSSMNLKSFCLSSWTTWSERYGFHPLTVRQYRFLIAPVNRSFTTSHDVRRTLNDIERTLTLWCTVLLAYRGVPQSSSRTSWRNSIGPSNARLEPSRQSGSKWNPTMVTHSHTNP